MTMRIINSGEFCFSRVKLYVIFDGIKFHAFYFLCLYTIKSIILNEMKTTKNKKKSPSNVTVKVDCILLRKFRLQFFDNLPAP